MRDGSTASRIPGAVIWAGIFCLWSFEYAIATPYFQKLGFSTQVALLLWCAGPLSGLLVGPIVGVFSDRCTSRYGRRRPFILGGVVCTVVAAILFASAQTVYESCKTADAQILAVVGFWLMDLSINTIQNPARALMADLCTGPEEQVTGQSLIARFCGLGYLLGFGIVSFWPQGIEHVKGIYVVGIAILLSTSAVTLCLAKEKPLSAAKDAKDPQQRSESSVHSVTSLNDVHAAVQDTAQCWDEIRSAFAQIFGGILHMTPAIRSIAVCQFLCWMGWFCFSPILTDFYALSLFGGSQSAKCMVSPSQAPDAQDQCHANASVTTVQCKPPSCHPCEFKLVSADCEQVCNFGRGVKAGALGLMLQNVVTVLCAYFVPMAQRRWNRTLTVRRMYAFILACMSLLFFLISVANFGSVGLTTFYVALTGIAQYGTQTYPYAIMGMSVEEGQRGLYMGVLTLCICIPQLLDVTYEGSIAAHLGTKWVIFVGALWALLAAMATRWLQVPGDGKGMHAAGTPSANSEDVNSEDAGTRGINPGVAAPVNGDGVNAL